MHKTVLKISDFFASCAPCVFCDFMISIIIPCKKNNFYLQECLEHIANLEYDDFEVIVLPDKSFQSRVKVVATGSMPPGKKRNIGAQKAQGEILAFVDDDAYPKSDWLFKAIKYLEDPGISAIGGPGITPESDSFWAQVSGAVYLSYLSGANPERFYPGKMKQVDDWPSMNFFISKKDFDQVGGFDEKYYPGEDTVLCNKLIKLNKKILYCPDVLVYHHRRKTLSGHLRQVGHHKRGLFIKKFPENSLRIKYFLPSLFLLFVLFGWLLLCLPQPFNLIYPLLWLIYFLAILAALIQIFIKIKKPAVALAVILYIIPTHLVYGWSFIRGMVRKK